jgi:hypothetical protein
LAFLPAKDLNHNITDWILIKIEDWS